MLTKLFTKYCRELEQRVNNFHGGYPRMNPTKCRDGAKSVLLATPDASSSKNAKKDGA